MHISFSPMRCDAALELSKTNDILTINGEAFDFSSLPDGGTIPFGMVPSEWIAGPVNRVAGELHLVLLLPHGPDPQQAEAFPQPVAITTNGPILLPTMIAGEPTHVDA